MTFQRVKMKVFFLLLTVIILFSACLYKKTIPFEREEKRYLPSKEETTQNPLKLLLTNLRLTERDLKVELPKTNENHFNVRFAAFESLKSKGLKAKHYLIDLINHKDSYPGYAFDLARDILEECRVDNW